MIEVSVQYRPVSFLPLTRRMEFSMPGSWREINARQLKSISMVDDPRADETKLISLFLGMDRQYARQLSSWQRYCILSQLKYLREIDYCDHFIIPGIGKLKAPQGRLENVTFGAFIFGDTYYLNYIAGRKEDLNRFIGCYYTRGKFSEKDIEPNAAIIRKVDPGIRQAIFINYTLIREWLARSYPYVFEKRTTKKKDRLNGWVGVFDAVVGDNIVQSDKYAELPISEVLRYLNAKVIESRKKN